MIGTCSKSTHKDATLQYDMYNLYYALSALTLGVHVQRFNKIVDTFISVYFFNSFLENTFHASQNFRNIRSFI